MTDRAFSDIFEGTVDAGEPLDITKELTPEDLIRYTVPAGGPFITGAPQSNTLAEGSDVLLSPIATIAANTLTDPMTVADVALFTEVSEGAAAGLTTLTSSLTAGFIYLPAEDPSNNVFAMNGQTLAGGVANYPALAAKWPAWVSGADIVLPDWRGRAMMATGALGITGSVGDTYADATSVNGLTATLRTRSTAGGNAFNEAVAAFTNTANLNQQGSVINQMSGDAETRPNAVGLVLCVIAGDLAVQTVDQTIPTAFHVTNTPGNQNGNGLRSNGVYRSNNAGPLNGSGFGNWTWRVKVTVIGDWVSQHYFNDTGNHSFRDSFDGGASWSSWGS